MTFVPTVMLVVLVGVAISLVFVGLVAWIVLGGWDKLW